MSSVAEELEVILPRYSIHTALEEHDWFLRMMQSNEELEVETDRAGEPPMPFWSETVRRVVVESLSFDNQRRPATVGIVTELGNRDRECKKSSPWRTHCQLQDEAS